ncbi:hypothetical protein ACFVIM_32100 [Streptomyces sp. NPDC057638]|uniref:hypothetical protein n=1 Tax=Streptomyces sp. NPDC057638 TaxID=3346190 RepID=UPI00368117DB
MNGERSRVRLCAVAVAGLAVTGLTACEPATTGLTPGAVSVTTDRTATQALERLGIKVKWFSCTGEVDRPRDGRTPSAKPGYATVSCEGETASDRSITLSGRVTEERSGTCVRGDLTARVSGKVAFKATFLGDCDRRPASPRFTAPTYVPPAYGEREREREKARERERRRQPGRATVTVTETVRMTEGAR